jgi:hypothetical protein
MPRSLRIGFEDAIDPVMIRGDRQELIVRDDPDRRLEPAEGSVEARSQNSQTFRVVSKVRTEHFLTGGH